MKVAFIIQRFGPEIYAGAEILVSQLANNLSDLFEIDVLSTTAKDAGTWDNYFKEGVENFQSFKLIRFSIDSPRDSKYVSLSRYLETHNDDLKKGQEFIEANGPISTNFLNYLKKNKNNYDLFIFFGYSYWLTFNGISIVKEKSLLFPQAHDEPWINFDIYKQVFQVPIGYIFQTNAEKQIVHKKFGFTDKPYEIVGHGMSLDFKNMDLHSNKKLPKKFLLYIGRISEGKGCQELSDYFNKYCESHNSDLELVMIGTIEHKIKNTKAKIFENISDEMKFDIISKSHIFVMPSAFESLNLALLESWLLKKPAIVNGKSVVLKEHCLQSNGGLFYENYEEFVECLDFILENKEIPTKLGINGYDYVKNNFNWASTRQKYSNFFSKISKMIT